MRRWLIFPTNAPVDPYNWVTYDDFNDNDLDTDLWTSDGTPYVSEQNQRIEAYSNYAHTKLTSSAANFPHVNGEGVQFSFLVTGGTANISVVLLNSSGTLIAQINYTGTHIYVRNCDSDPWTTVATDAPSATSHPATISMIFTDNGVTFTVSVPDEDYSIDADVNFTIDTNYFIRTMTVNGSGTNYYYLDEIRVTENLFS